MPTPRFIRTLAVWLALSPLVAAAQTISQPLDNGNSSAGALGGTGQSFIATMTGFVTGIDVRSATNRSDTTLRLYNAANGSGITSTVGTPAYTQTGVALSAVASGGAFSHIALTTPFPVVAGNSYTLMLGELSGPQLLIFNAWDVYASGNMVNNFGNPSAAGNGDLAFQVYEVAAAADLQVTQIASSTSATVGSTITYTVTFTNNGPSTASAVTLADNLAAAGLTLVTAHSSVGVLTTSASSLSLNVGSLAPGASGTLTVVASVAAGGGTIDHTVSIGSTTADTVSANNSSTHLATRVAVAAAIPTLSQWAMILLTAMTAGFALLGLRRF